MWSVGSMSKYMHQNVQNDRIWDVVSGVVHSEERVRSGGAWPWAGSVWDEAGEKRECAGGTKSRALNLQRVRVSLSAPSFPLIRRSLSDSLDLPAINPGCELLNGTTAALSAALTTTRHDMLMTPASPSPVARPRRHTRSTSGSTFEGAAFAPLPNVPRRARANTEADLSRTAPRPTRVKKAEFLIGGSSEEDEDDCPLVREVNQRARLAKQTAADDEHFGNFSYDAEAHRKESQADVAFPTLSASPERIQAPLPPLTIPESNVARSASSPSLSNPPSTTPGLSSVSSTNSYNSGASTPIYLKNGRPLKPSLKSRVSLSLSTPDVASMRAHAKSAPTTPRVHFPTRERLESVVLFDKRARPLEVASGDSPIASPRFYGDDPDDVPPAGLRIRPQSSFPFPSMPRASTNLQGLSAALMAKTKLKIAVARSAPLQPNPHPDAHVHLAAVRLLATRLSGSVLVKNVSFNKRVSVRYTFDNWETTSEVSGMWSSPNALADLPKADLKPFGDEETELDVARGILVPVPAGWDRFTFNVKLDDVAPFLSARSMLVAVKFEAAGVGEWWDSCGGRNYRFEFDHVPRKEKKEEPKKEEPKIVGRPRSNTSPAPLSTDATFIDPPSASLLTTKLNEVAQEVKTPTPQVPVFALNPPTPEAKTPTPESKTPTPTPKASERPALKLNFPSDKTITPDMMTPTPSDLGSDLGAEMAGPKLGLGLVVTREHKPLTPPDSASSSPREAPAPLPKPSTQVPNALPSPEDSPSSAKRQSSPLPSASAVAAPAHSTTNVKDQSYADFIAKYCFAGAAPAPAPSSTSTNHGPSHGHARSASASAAYGYGGYTTASHTSPFQNTQSPAPNFGWGSTSHSSWGGVGFNYGTSFSGGDY